MEINKVYNMDCIEGLRTLPDNSVDCCVTSPPYYALRDYGTGHWEGGDPNCNHESAKIKTRFDYSISEKQKSSKGTDVPNHKKVCPTCGAIYIDCQIGLEDTPQAYIDRLTEVFTEVLRVLKPEGTLWLNIGDSYWGGGWRNATFNEHSGNIQKGSKGTYCGDTMPACKGKQGDYKPKDLIGIPWMLAFSLRSAGWYLRQDIIWEKGNPMPESVTDRCTKSHEYIFLMSKSQRYYFDYEAIQEPATSSTKPRMFGAKQQNGTMRNDIGNTYKPRTKNCMEDGQKPNTMHLRREAGLPDEQYVVRNKRDVWSVNVKPDTVAHFATYPEELIRPCILAGCPKDGIVLDPFMGSGTTARVAMKLDRNYIGFELNPEYCKIINTKTREIQKELFT